MNIKKNKICKVRQSSILDREGHVSSDDSKPSKQLFSHGREAKANGMDPSRHCEHDASGGQVESNRTRSSSIAGTANTEDTPEVRRHTHSVIHPVDPMTVSAEDEDEQVFDAMLQREDLRAAAVRFTVDKSDASLDELCAQLGRSGKEWDCALCESRKVLHKWEDETFFSLVMISQLTVSNMNGGILMCLIIPTLVMIMIVMVMMIMRL